jgi:membrane fusion protein (multidrug efflux system)
VRTITEVRRNALLIPQRAVTELQGAFRVAVVDDNNKVSIRTVKVGERSGAQIAIEEGLNPGERVIAEGTQKVKPDTVVTPKPFTLTETAAAPK